MELAEATRQALLILEEEQISPTVGYEFVSAHWRQHLQSLTDVVQSYSKPQTGNVNIYTIRQQRPRKVSETPMLYVFRSENYGYLRTLFEQVSEGDRDAFISTLLELVPSGKSSRESIERARFPQVSNSVSCFPLLAEFCIRTNFTGALLESLQTIALPQVGVAVMLLQLEETIALNYDIFLESDLKAIPAALDNLYKVAELQTYKTKGPRGGKQVTNPHYRGGFEATGREIIGAIDGIREECRKALFYYLRDGLKQRPNLQIEADKKIVVDYLTKLGFGTEMVGALNAAEVEYKSASNQALHTPER
jgi:hypothetical protein